MAQRVPLLAGNWKMYGPPSEARALAAEGRAVVVIAGGYGRDINDTVRVHANTARIARSFA